MTEHPARPEQLDSGFAEGQEGQPDPPEERLEDDFARGQDSVGPESHPDFGEGQRRDPEHDSEGNFARGMEQGPEAGGGSPAAGDDRP